MDSTLRKPSSLPKGVPSVGMTPMCAHSERDPVDTARNRLLLLSAMMPALNDASMCDIAITARGARQALYRCHQQQHPLFLGHRHDDASIYDMLLRVQQTPTENNNVEVPPMREPVSKARRKLVQLSANGTTTSSFHIPSPTAVSSMPLLDDPSGSSSPPPRENPLLSKAPPSLSRADLEPRHPSNESVQRASMTPLRNTPGIGQILEQSNSLALSMNMEERERSVSPPGPDYVTYAVDQHTATMKGSWWSSTDSLSYLYNNPHGSSKEMRRSALKMTNDIRMGWQRPRLVTHLLQAKVEREMSARRKGGKLEAIGKVVANAGGLKTVRALLKICPDPMAATQEVFHNEEFRNAVLPVVYDTTVWDEEVYFGKVVRAIPTSPVAPLDTTQNAPFGNSHSVLDCARIKKNNGVRLPTFHTPVLHWGKHRDDNTAGSATASPSPPPLTSSTRNKILTGDSSASKCIYSADIQDWVETCIVQPFIRPVRLVRGADGVSVRLRTDADGPDVVDITGEVDYETRDSFNSLLTEYHTLNDFEDIVPAKGPISICGQLRAILAGKHLHPSFGHLSDHPYLEGLSSSPKVAANNEPTADDCNQEEGVTPSSPCCISEIAGDLSSLAALQDTVRNMIRTGKIAALLTGLDGGALPRIPPLVSPMIPSSLLTNIANRQFADSVCPPPTPGVKVEKGVSKNKVALILLGTPSITRCDVSSEKVWVDLLGPMQRNEALETKRRAANLSGGGKNGVPPVGDDAIAPDEPEAMKVKVNDLSIGLGPLRITLIPYPTLQAANAAKKLLDGYLASSVEAPSSRLDNNRYTRATQHDHASDVDSADEELLAALGGEVDERSGQRPLDVDTPVRRQESNNKNTSFLRRRRPPGRVPKEVVLPYSLAALPKPVLDFLATQPWSTVACTKTGFVDVDDITLSCAIRMSIHIGKEGFVKVFNHNDKAEWEEREAVYHRGLRRYCYERADVADYFESNKPRTDPTIKTKCAEAEKEAAKLIKAKWAECEGYRQKDLFNLSSFDISVRSFSNYGALASGAISLLKPILRGIIESELRAMVKAGRVLI